MPIVFCNSCCLWKWVQSYLVHYICILTRENFSYFKICFLELFRTPEDLTKLDTGEKNQFFITFHYNAGKKRVSGYSQLFPGDKWDDTVYKKRAKEGTENIHKEQQVLKQYTQRGNEDVTKDQNTEQQEQLCNNSWRGESEGGHKQLQTISDFLCMDGERSKGYDLCYTL